MRPTSSACCGGSRRRNSSTPCRRRCSGVTRSIEFLFGERRGFCEHYASAFAVLLRAAGIPARVVVGYQGMAPSLPRAYLLVHQFDAHAWTEAWLDGRGWVRFDPTAAVAPDRIESGAGEALGAEFLADSPLAIELQRAAAGLDAHALGHDDLPLGAAGAELRRRARARCSRTCWAGSARRAWSR